MSMRHTDLRPAHLAGLGIALALAGLPASPLLAQEESFDLRAPFTRSFNVERGARVRIFSHMGDLDVRGSGGQSVELTADQSRGSDSDIRLVVLRSRGQITICVLPRDRGECSERGAQVRGWDGRDRRDSRRRAHVKLRVSVPASAVIQASSGNGNVTVTGFTGEVGAASGNGVVIVRDVGGAVHAASGNGAVTVDTRGGPVNASTGNGRITVRMERVPADASLGFHSGNGNIEITLPPEFGGEIDFNSGNGSVNSEFPVSVQGRFSSHRMRGTIGSGGARIRATTGNGNLVLRRR
jgi:hypothetical protein